MSDRRLFALLALLLGIVGGVLLLLEGIGDLQRVTVERVLEGVSAFALGLAGLLGAFAIYGGRYRTGGILNVLIGLVAAVVATLTGGLLLVVSGILGLVAHEG